MIRFTCGNDQLNFYSRCEKNRLEGPRLGAEDLLKGCWESPARDDDDWNSRIVRMERRVRPFWSLGRDLSCS